MKGGNGVREANGITHSPKANQKFELRKPNRRSQQPFRIADVSPQQKASRSSTQSSRSFKDNFADVAGMSLGGFWERLGGLWEIQTLPSASQKIPSNSQIIPSFSFAPSPRCRLLHFIFVSCTIKRTKSPGRLYVRFLSRVD